MSGRVFSIGLMVIAKCFVPGIAIGQLNTVPPPPPPTNTGGVGSVNTGPSGTSGDPSIIFEPPPPVVVDGIPASKLSEEQLRGFLQSKVRDIYQMGEQVEIIRVAPGYPVTLKYTDVLNDVIVGDDQLIGVTKVGKLLVLKASAGQGDTNMKVSISGARLLNYHVFVEESFGSADSTLIVHTDDNSSGSNGGNNSRATPSFAQIAKIVGSYDTLVKEGSIDSRDVSRVPIFKKSVFGQFEYFDWYVFADGTATLTFSVLNASGSTVTLPPNRLRLQIGNVRFMPKLVSISQRKLTPASSATGLAVFPAPQFRLTQPFELVFQ